MHDNAYHMPPHRLFVQFAAELSGCECMDCVQLQRTAELCEELKLPAVEVAHHDEAARLIGLLLDGKHSRRVTIDAD